MSLLQEYVMKISQFWNKEVSLSEKVMFLATYGLIMSSMDFCAGIFIMISPSFLQMIREAIQKNVLNSRLGN